jgi:putative DNA primase/helicase
VSSLLDRQVEGALAKGATEDRVALAFAHANREVLRFNHRRQLWYEWDGTRWREEKTELALEYARRFARKANSNGKGGPKSGPERASFARGVETFAQGDRALALRGDEFDTDPYLVNTPAGTIDLRTGEQRAHRHEDLITMCCAVAPSRSPAPAFTRFLLDITCGDASLVAYLQQALGACLSGAPEDHWLQFWYGAGRNGKSTLGEIVMYAMGDYAKKISAQTLMHDRHGSRHPTEVANLLGIRLAVSSEVAEGDYWDEARIKEVTGDAMLSARFMRCDFFEFKRTHKHLVYGNHRPMLRVVDPAMAERLHVVPFNASFTAESGNLDTQMGAKLREEAGAILQWLLDGHELWREAGTLRPCAAVAAATKDYFESQSTLDMWIEERCEVVLKDERPWDLLDRADALYKDFAAWKEQRGEYPLSRVRWGEQIGRHFVKERRTTGVRYRGLKLRLM